ncbi:MAG: hypothetical protein C0582_04330 [Alphaproteobacteria bacterium]|nr:MAG: hypothetical protein C0582_04330 [Alphaproteobacteria bacterium]
MNILEITPDELQPLLEKGSVCLVDVREPWEVEMCSIEPSLKIPLGQLPDRASELAEKSPLIFYCHHGVRSLKAVQILASADIPAKSLKGGIDLWSEVIDPTCPKY